MQDKFQARQLIFQLPRLPRIIALLLGGDGRNAAGEIGPGGLRIRLDLGFQRIKPRLFFHYCFSAHFLHQSLNPLLRPQHSPLQRLGFLKMIFFQTKKFRLVLFYFLDPVCKKQNRAGNIA